MIAAFCIAGIALILAVLEAWLGPRDRRLLDTRRPDPAAPVLFHTEDRRSFTERREETLLEQAKRAPGSQSKVKETP